MKQLETSADIHQLVSTFYNKVLQDAQLAPFFQKLDFSAHLPQMEKFWRFALLSEQGYTTNVTEKHADMSLNKVLFDRWVRLFSETVDSIFDGEKANLAKQRATIMGWTMASKHGN